MKIYYCKTDKFEEADDCFVAPGRRKCRMKRYMKKEDRLLCLVSTLMLQLMFGKDFEKRLAYSEHGKPYLLNSSIYFSISHSSNVALLATADCELGSDIQHIAPVSEKIAKRCFTPNEISWMHTQENGFYKLWTAKESIMKATGLGFALNPCDFDVLPLDDSPHQVFAKSWHLYSHSLPGYEICSASLAKQCSVEYIEFSRGDLI